MPTPEDTSQRDPWLHLLGAMSDGTSGYIEGMEVAGQRQLVASTTLPVDLLYSTEEEFTDLGFTFGDKVDDLFREATLPEGWTRKGSDHAMWSHIVDERGIERVAIFYKAAFYDRAAHMSLSRPGSSLASQAVYEKATEVPEWDVLTAQERADFHATLQHRLARTQEHPGIYGDEAPAIAALVERYGSES